MLPKKVNHFNYLREDPGKIFARKKIEGALQDWSF